MSVAAFGTLGSKPSLAPHFANDRIESSHLVPLKQRLHFAALHTDNAMLGYDASKRMSLGKEKCQMST
jgi:hypothetical protein